MKTAWVFPGQGSQAVGMGVDLLPTAIAKEKYQQAEEILGWSVVEKCQGDEASLALTQNTQPCLYVIEAILADLLKDKGFQPDYVAGHSLGEYSALYAAGVFDFATGLQLVKERSEVMAGVSGGMMAALMKFDQNHLQTALANNPEVVLANDNSPEQVVVSGTVGGVETILASVKARRAVPLKVSGAFHSSFMAQPSRAFAQTLEACRFNDATVPVLSNVDPNPSQNGDRLKEKLIQQMTSSVRWRETMVTLEEIGVTDYWEVGPGKVLTGLCKRTCPDLNLKNIGQLEDLNSL
ncbi:MULTISPECIES: ACP S-malonyltransferase [unclassified Synechocystis]|uniref:ACP S-malonyltransferase n=1 Tax=unclassified Synechocystis TaxID=2640012 RepID=UPI000429EFC8|nr:MULTISPECIES: ACP S-malonyltransferase [unclassified Synechocystis]AIE74306.1 Malonyl CoA-acyl carrier protein transacylase [Synechocystis sp. PCC 6714]MCT0254908.1 ACP S-malonyltransferase [Synechocystis sp. CS-94]